MEFRKHEAVQGKRDAYPVDPRQLKIKPGYNVRDLTTPEAIEKLAELEASIIENGVRVPLEVQFDGTDIWVMAGHRRYTATMNAINNGHDIKTVLCVPEPKGTSEIDRILNLVISNSGEPLDPLAKAEVCRRLVAHGWDNTQIAKRLGWKSPAMVDDYLRVRAAEPEVQAMVRSGEVSMTTAAAVVKADGPKAVETLQRAKVEAEAAGKTKITAAAVNKANGVTTIKPAAVKTLVAAATDLAQLISEDPACVANPAIREALSAVQEALGITPERQAA